MQAAITVNCTNGGALCTALNGGLTFTRVNGSRYRGSDGGSYHGGNAGGIGVMLPVIDLRPPSPIATIPSGSTGTSLDQYGSGSGFHDWYLIAVALITLYLVMRFAPKWGVPLGYLVLAGAVLSTEPAVNGFNRLVRSIQTGSIQ